LEGRHAIRNREIVLMMAKGKLAASASRIEGGDENGNRLMQSNNSGYLEWVASKVKKASLRGATLGVDGR
jgi:hypothetical protein